MKKVLLALVLALGLTATADAQGILGQNSYNRGYRDALQQHYQHDHHHNSYHYRGYNYNTPPYWYGHGSTWRPNNYGVYNPYLQNGGVGYGSWYYQQQNYYSRPYNNSYGFGFYFGR